MLTIFIKLHVKAHRFRGDCGQDLIEYAMVATLIALAATAGMSSVASDVNAAFARVGNLLSTYT